MRHKPNTENERGVSSTTGSILLVSIVVILTGTIGTVALGQFGGVAPEPAPVVAITAETENINNGVAKDDTVILTHESGETLSRGELIVQIGQDTVFNRSVNADTLSGGQLNKKTNGVVVEVDDNAWNDLTSPVNEWGDDEVQAGDQLIIKDRNYNHPNVYDVINKNDKITVIWVDKEDRRFVLFSETI